MSDITKRIFTYSPVDTKLIANRWHHHSLTTRGYKMEGKVFLRSKLRPKGKTRKKFIIFGRARSGTTLLGRILNAPSMVRCDGEMLQCGVLRPTSFLNDLARKSPEEVYGAKLLSYQMVQVQRIKDPVDFFQSLEDRGFLFIHLTRKTFAQTLSLTIAQKRSVYHRKEKEKEQRKIRLDPEDFRKRIEWNEALLEYEAHCMSAFNPIRVSYEEDLATEGKRVKSIEKIFSLLDVPNQNVSTPLQKILPSHPSDILENYDEVAKHLTKSGLGHLL